MRDRLRIKRKVLGRHCFGVRSTKIAPVYRGTMNSGSLRPGKPHRMRFATRLNAGLEIDPGKQGNRVARSSRHEFVAHGPIVHKCWSAARSCLFKIPPIAIHAHVTGPRETFCRIVRSEPLITRIPPSGLRDALFDAMHFVCPCGPCRLPNGSDYGRLGKLHAGLKKSVPGILNI